VNSRIASFSVLEQIFLNKFLVSFVEENFPEEIAYEEECDDDERDEKWREVRE